MCHTDPSLAHSIAPPGPSAEEEESARGDPARHTRLAALLQVDRLCPASLARGLRTPSPCPGGLLIRVGKVSTCLFRHLPVSSRLSPWLEAPAWPGWMGWVKSEWSGRAPVRRRPELSLTEEVERSESCQEVRQGSLWGYWRDGPGEWVSYIISFLNEPGSKEFRKRLELQ